MRSLGTSPLASAVVFLLLSCLPVTVAAQSDDVALGTEAAAIVRARVALVKDDGVTAFVTEIGRRLVEALPDSARQPAFTYSFDILDEMYVASYGLPGGPVFVSRGLLQGAASQQAVAEAIARSISHVALRHSTTQATSADAFQLGAITGADIGTVIAGPQCSILAQGAGFGVASYFLIYREEFEKQAAQLVSRLLAAAGEEPSADRFRMMQARLRDLPSSSRSPETVTGAGARVSVIVPAGESQAVSLGNRLVVSVPANWTRIAAGNSVAFAPDGGFLKTPGGALTVTHGVQIGMARSVAGDIQRDMQTLLETLARVGVNARWRPSYQATTLAGRQALTTSLLNVSAATGAFEQAFVWVAHLSGGQLIYLIGVSPLDESAVYRSAFDRIRESIRLGP